MSRVGVTEHLYGMTSLELAVGRCRSIMTDIAGCYAPIDRVVMSCSGLIYRHSRATSSSPIATRLETDVLEPFVRYKKDLEGFARAFARCDATLGEVAEAPTPVSAAAKVADFVKTLETAHATYLCSGTEKAIEAEVRRGDLDALLDDNGLLRALVAARHLDNDLLDDLVPAHREATALMEALLGSLIDDRPPDPT